MGRYSQRTSDEEWENIRLRNEMDRQQDDQRQAAQMADSKYRHLQHSAEGYAEEAAENMLEICTEAVPKAVEMVIQDYKGRNLEDWGLIDEETRKDIRFQWERAIITALCEAAE